MKRDLNFEILEDLGITIKTVNELQKKIDNLLFNETKEKNSLAQYDYFINNFPESSYYQEVIILRNQFFLL